MGRDRGLAVEPGRYDYFECSSSTGGSVEAASVEGVGRVVGEAGAVASGSAASVSFAGPFALFAAAVSGGGSVRAVYGYAVVGGAVPRARFAEWGDVQAADGGVDAAGVVGGRDRGLAGAARWGAEARLVAGARGRVAGRGEKGGEKIARSLLGKPASRYHLAVDANGLPLALRLAAGNENERLHLLPLVDELIARALRPREVWADRGYDSKALDQGLLERGIDPHISRRRRAGDPIPAGAATGEVWRGRKRQTKTSDPDARHRWPIERTNAWLKAKRRIATRRDRKADNYLAFLNLGAILILANAL